MNILELFSGTGSIGKICKELDWNCLSIDRDLPADINIDILEWDYKQYPNDSFDIVWASPPCAVWSKLQDCWLGRKKKDGIIFTKEILNENIELYGKPLVDRTLEIIEYFKQGNPNLIYFIENPATSKMKDYIKMDSVVVSYCKYADWGYRKNTRIWSNVKGFTPKICKNDCNNIITIETQEGDKHVGYGYEMINGKKVLCNTKEKRDKTLRTLHKTNCGKTESLQAIRKAHKVLLDKAGNGNQYNQEKDLKFLGKGTNRIDRYRIPPELIRELFVCCI